LFADAGDVERWRHEFSGVTELKVGIAWQGSPTFGQDRLRSIPLAHYLPLASIPGVRLYSVQMGFGREQLQELGSAAPVIDLGDRLGDFLHTAAIMRNLDLLIGIDSSQSHLAGALGVPVWLALAHAADWRWFTDREDTPWYPRTRLFRQTVLGQWNDVFQRIAVELEQLAQQRG
jgi:hypothetical protein